MTRRCATLLVLAIMLVTAPVITAEPATQPDRPARKVMAFYYPWYGHRADKDGSGRDSHWDGIDEPAKRIASAAHYPVLGPFDSHDPKVIAQHCEWAKKANIDVLISSWWGQGDLTDVVLPRLPADCAKAGLELTIYYERVPQPQTAESAARDIVALLKRYGKDPAWLKVDGRPVVFIYSRAIEEIGLAGWAEAIERINRDYPGGAVLIGDRLSQSAASVFAGIHTYNTAGHLSGLPLTQADEWIAKAFPQAVEMARNHGRISTVTVIPGYDDTKIRKPGLAVDRLDGRLYRAQWDRVPDDCDWVLITSFNEWHEGSEIEPSVEFGEKYLGLTADFAKRFKSRQRNPVEPKQSKITAVERAGLREKLADRVAVLPGPESYAYFWLAELGVRPQLLTWEQVADGTADARKFPMLLYAGGEKYRQTVKQHGDVDAAIAKYLKAGGCLVVLPSGPMPFYRNEKDEAVNTASTFGLNIGIGSTSGGFEKPPTGKRLWFVNRQAGLPHLPGTFPFPGVGDRRWRPFLSNIEPTGCGPGGEPHGITGFGELYDGGKSYGRWAGEVVHHGCKLDGGRVLYAWFGLLESPEADDLLFDLFSLAAGKITPAPPAK